jgi:hypothetical protein
MSTMARGSRRRFTARSAIALPIVTAALLLAAAGPASADPVNSPQTSSGELVCGSTTYTVVSPNHAPVGQMVTANGTNSTSVQIMILDKAASFSQSKLTQCTFIGPDGFTVSLLVTPVPNDGPPRS